jgi:cytochrome c oxidase cbb3-type subunit 2
MTQRHSSLVSGVAVVIGVVLLQAVGGRAAESENELTRGRAVYMEQCASCHGVRGDGRSEVASSLNPRPRNFTIGVYKFRSTPTGQLPTDEDLLRTITAGIPGTSMDRYADLPERDRRALVVYLKSLSPRFQSESAGPPISVPSGRPVSLDAAARGYVVYDRMRCAACHGDGARGDGPLAEDLLDEDGLPIRPADLTKPGLKGGPGPEALYRTVMTGLDGTPMPSYGDSLKPSDAWDLALYVLSLSQTKGVQ